MSTAKSIAAACLLVAASSAAEAAPIDLGTYYASDYNGQRSIWGASIVHGESHYWTAQSSTLHLGATSGYLTGTFVNGTASSQNTDLVIDVHLAFTPQLAVGGSSGYCQFDGTPNPGCSKKGSPAVDPSMWRYYTLDAANSYFKGASAAMAGLEWMVTDHSSGNHPPQFGLGANALEEEDLGWSMWFELDIVSLFDPVDGDGYKFKSADGHADFNMDLVAAPLPAPAFLLLAGLGGVAALKRRKKVG